MKVVNVNLDHVAPDNLVLLPGSDETRYSLNLGYKKYTGRFEVSREARRTLGSVRKFMLDITLKHKELFVSSITVCIGTQVIMRMFKDAVRCFMSSADGLTYRYDLTKVFIPEENGVWQIDTFADQDMFITTQVEVMKGAEEPATGVWDDTVTMSAEFTVPKVHVAHDSDFAHPAYLSCVKQFSYDSTVVLARDLDKNGGTASVRL